MHCIPPQDTGGQDAAATQFLRSEHLGLKFAPFIVNVGAFFCFHSCNAQEVAGNQKYTGIMRERILFNVHRPGLFQSQVKDFRTFSVPAIFANCARVIWPSTDNGKTDTRPFFLPNEAHHGNPRSWTLHICKVRYGHCRGFPTPLSFICESFSFIGLFLYLYEKS